jgi:hypothetical protein
LGALCRHFEIGFPLDEAILRLLARLASTWDIAFRHGDKRLTLYYSYDVVVGALRHDEVTDVYY